MKLFNEHSCSWSVDENLRGILWLTYVLTGSSSICISYCQTLSRLCKIRSAICQRSSVWFNLPFPHADWLLIATSYLWGVGEAALWAEVVRLQCGLILLVLGLMGLEVVKICEVLDILMRWQLQIFISCGLAVCFLLQLAVLLSSWIPACFVSTTCTLLPFASYFLGWKTWSVWGYFLSHWSTSDSEKIHEQPLLVLMIFESILYFFHNYFYSTTFASFRKFHTRAHFSSHVGRFLFF